MTNDSQLRELLIKEISYYYDLLEDKSYASREELVHVSRMRRHLLNNDIDDRELVKELSSAVSRWITNRFK